MSSGVIMWNQIWRNSLIDTNSFIVYIKAEGIYVDIAKDVEMRCVASNYELDRSLPKGKKI